MRLALPDNTRACRVLRESFSRDGIAMDAWRGTRSGGRSVVLRPPPGAPEASFAARFDVHLLPSPPEDAEGPPKALVPDARRGWLRREPRIQTDSPIVRRAQAALASSDAGSDRLLRAFYLHCCTALAGDELDGHPDAAGALETGRATPAGRARAMVALCRVSGIPARCVAGFILQADHARRPSVWVEAHDGGRWVPFDPEHGYAGRLPAAWLAVRRGGTEIASRDGGVALDGELRAYPIGPDGLAAPAPRTALGLAADLTRLPVGVQHTLAVLLLLPAGALITAVFRNIVGVQTFGTFTPALLGLSFLYADVWTGLAVLGIALAVGLALRGLLERLRLLLVARLGVLLTAVVLCVAAAVSVLDLAGLTPSGRAVILPLVIVTMLIERFYVTAEEDGLGESLKLLAGTVAVAAACLALLRWETLSWPVLRAPEYLLFVAAALVGVGRYAGLAVQLANGLGRLERMATAARLPGQARRGLPPGVAAIGT